MRVSLDVSCLDHQQISGIGVYAKQLAHHLNQDPAVELSLVYKASRWKKRAWIDGHSPIKAHPYFPTMTGRWGSGADLFHGPDFRIPAGHRRFKKVVTIHDLAFVEPGMTSPDFAKKRKELLDLTLKHHQPDGVITVSNYTRQVLIQHYPEWENRTQAIWLGADHIPAPEGLETRPLDAPYFLFVGNLEARKNVIGLLHGFEGLQDHPHLKDVRLVIIGKPGYAFAEINEVLQKSPVKDRVIRPGFVSNEKLKAYYQHALAFVLPSWYEGFGIPVLEAMTFSCPVITSSRTATQEVVGDSALLVNPAKSEEITEAMVRIAEDEALRVGLKEKGISRCRGFTWSRCAKDTVKFYQHCL